LSRPVAVSGIAALALGISAPAFGSTLITRNATNVKLAVSKSGKALVTYKLKGKTRRVLVWGAVDALVPVQNVAQVAFRFDYTAGGKTYWSHFKNKCKAYDGPPLADLVTACKASDGSYWALQQWQPWIPLLGFTPWLPSQTDVAFHISHWSRPPAQLDVWTDWIDTSHGSASPHELFGRLTYDGIPVHGFSTNSVGAPLDAYGRVVFIDTLDSAYGPGWQRETGIVTRNPSGVFCHAFVPQTPAPGYPNRDLRPAANGSSYRLTVQGPGVTPDLVYVVADPGDFNPADPAKVAQERAAKAVLQQISAPQVCLKGH
jgi:hypothetical protein